MRSKTELQINDEAKVQKLKISEIIINIRKKKPEGYIPNERTR